MSGVVVPAVFTLVRGWDQWRVRVDLSWSPDDPLAVSMVFHDGKSRRPEWVMSRELLIAALTSSDAGDGDVQFWDPEGCPGCVGVELDSPSGRAEFHAPRAALIDVIVASEPFFRSAVDAWRDAWAEQVPA